MKNENRVTFNDGENDVTVGDDEWKANVLNTDPFAGDFFDGAVLSDKIVKSRKSLKLCSGCFSICKPGSFNRVITERVDGDLMRHRFCEECCTADAYGEMLYEGNIYIDPYDDEAWDAACTYNEKTKEWDEPKSLFDSRESLLSENQNYLYSKLGKNWQDLPDIVIYEAMSYKETEYLLSSEANKKRLLESVESIKTL